MRLEAPPVFSAFLESAAQWRALPHEYAFGGWLAAMALWLLWVAGPGDPHSQVFVACALLSAVLIVWCQRRPTPLRWRLRLLWYPSAMGLSFYTLPGAVAALGRPNADALLAAADQRLLGQPAAQVLQPFASPGLTDLLTVCYLFFFVVLILGPGHYCLRDLARFRACIVGLFVLYAVGFAGYVALPAGGPFRALAALPPLPAGPFARLAHPLIVGGSNGVDVFPSIHFAASLYLLLFDWWHHQRRFWQWLPPIVLLWVSTVYLRYHYLVDLIAGLPVAGLGLWVMHRYRRSELAGRTDADMFVARPSPQG
ncbi:MAG: phosphatase PAP2 family protein [Nevskiaceae bacterium]|nr:MAG: phosphatase PAP2 family protein [Nevskiaceae bacterium]TAM26371.1 MAG: phosphatase PAP2 family protein [Nevskiaceae bacterium]